MAWLTADLGPGVTATVTTRADGVSEPPYESLDLAYHVGDRPAHVRANRARVSAALGVPVVYVDQVHGREVVEVRGPSGTGPPARGDALVTDRPGIALAVLVADCLPVLLADAEAGVVGAAHAGRRGLTLGVVPATVAAMTGLGARPRRIRAFLGPAICGACYEVGADVRAEVAALVPQAASTTAWGTPAVDLAAGVRGQLLEAGVEEWAESGLCTRQDPRFFSYRRDGVTGRCAGVVALADRDTPTPRS